MNDISTYTVHHCPRLDFLNLMQQVPGHDLGNTSALIHQALRGHLISAGYPTDAFHLGAIHSVAKTSEGRTCLVDVKFANRQEVARVTLLTSEIEAIFHHRVIVEEFAEHALNLIRHPHQHVVVGSLEPRTDGRIDLRLVDSRSHGTVWHAEPFATCLEVLHAISDAMGGRQTEAA